MGRSPVLPLNSLVTLDMYSIPRRMSLKRMTAVSAYKVPNGRPPSVLALSPVTTTAKKETEAQR